MELIYVSVAKVTFLKGGTVLQRRRHHQPVICIYIINRPPGGACSLDSKFLTSMRRVIRRAYFMAVDMMYGKPVTSFHFWFLRYINLK